MRALFPAFLGLTLWLSLLVAPAAAHWQPKEGQDLIGTKAPEFAGLQWLNSAPLTIAGLRGKAVFIRFWSMNCPYCAATAPTLNYLNQKYGRQGLVVIAIHHPKGEGEELRAAKNVEHTANLYGFKFPVALDNDWQTLNRYWTSKSRAFTSASFLIDRQGRIAWVHDGGTFALPKRYGGDEPDSAAFDSLAVALGTALAPSK
ncbi:MAG TPA: redoxin domain-containing protein [Planktothrix sp.]|jgi:thiol-disulfide isomerase/thioredoxin